MSHGITQDSSISQMWAGTPATYASAHQSQHDWSFHASNAKANAPVLCRTSACGFKRQGSGSGSTSAGSDADDYLSLFESVSGSDKDGLSFYGRFVSESSEPAVSPPQYSMHEPMKVTIGDDFAYQKPAALQSACIRLQAALADWEARVLSLSPAESAVPGNAALLSAMSGSMIAMMARHTASPTAVQGELNAQRASNRQAQKVVADAILARMAATSIPPQTGAAQQVYTPGLVPGPIQDRPTTFDSSGDYSCSSSDSKLHGDVTDLFCHQGKSASFRRSEEMQKLASRSKPDSQVKEPPRAGQTKEAPLTSNSSMNSLRANLEDLRSVDASRVFIARKIDRLGIQGQQLLEDHFSQYGKVERLLVVQRAGKAGDSRVRPSGPCFVVMEKPEDAQFILACGSDHHVWGGPDSGTVVVSVTPFKPTTDMDGEK